MKTSFNFSTFNLKAGLFALAVGALVAACADYNVTDDFTAEPDPTFVEPYKDYGTVKSYLDREKYPNMTLGAQLKVAEFNKQELAHAVAITNFDDLAFGTTLMSGTIVNAKGIMNFLDMKDLLDHVQEIGGKVFGSPIVANANQADDWLNMLTAPIEIPVDYVEGKTVNFNEMSVGDYTASRLTPSPPIPSPSGRRPTRMPPTISPSPATRSRVTVLTEPGRSSLANGTRLL